MITVCCGAVDDYSHPHTVPLHDEVSTYDPAALSIQAPHHQPPVAEYSMTGAAQASSGSQPPYYVEGVGSQTDGYLPHSSQSFSHQKQVLYHDQHPPATQYTGYYPQATEPVSYRLSNSLCPA